LLGIIFDLFEPKKAWRVWNTWLVNDDFSPTALPLNSSGDTANLFCARGKVPDADLSIE
jgi:hypothetical protein